MGLQGGISEEKMDGVSASVVIGLAVLLVAWIFFKSRHGSSDQKLKLPPGPRPLPIIGNLHMLGKLPHRKLRELSKKYGPIMFLRLGSVPTVVASTPEMAKEFLKTHDLNFASRPATCAGKYVTYNSTDVGFAPYGPYWRKMRKVCMLELLSAKRIESMKFIREEEIAVMRERIMKQCGVNGSNPVNVSKVVSTYATDIICRMAFGRKYSEETLTDSRGFKIMIQEVFYVGGEVNIGDFIPYLEWMDLQGLRRRQKHIHKVFDDFFEKIIQEHVENKSRDHRDFVDVMLQLSEDNTMDIEITRDNIKAVILDMLSAGTDTSSATLEWAMSELLLNPSMMKKAQDELQSVVGLNRMVEESDLPQLEYLQVVVKETLRLHPPGPLLIPHEAREDCVVAGYNIPKKARIIVNVFAVGTDPNSWEDADMFKPERFIGSPIDIKGQDFEVIPFGSGRRGCPGQPLGTTVVEYALATLLHCFDWRLPDGMKAEDLSMAEEFGLSTPRTVHLLAVPTPRLSHP
eukprot:Gb_00367 [translate_table: standard]